MAEQRLRIGPSLSNPNHRMLHALALESGPIGYRIAGTGTVTGVTPIAYRHGGEIRAQDLMRGASRGPR